MSASGYIGFSHDAFLDVCVVVRGWQRIASVLLSSGLYGRKRVFVQAKKRGKRS